MSRVWISKFTCCFSYWGGGHVAVGISLSYFCFYSLSLSQFQSIFVSFVAISAAVYGPMSLFQGHVLVVEESGQNKWLKGGAIPPLLYGPNGFKVWKWKKERVKIRWYHFYYKPTLPEKTAYGLSSLECHTSPPPFPWGRISLPRAPHGLGGGDVWHFRLPMDIDVHDPGINKGASIQKKHMSVL